jgi:hypothetical protein
MTDDVLLWPRARPADDGLGFQACVCRAWWWSYCRLLGIMQHHTVGVEVAMAANVVELQIQMQELTARVDVMAATWQPWAASESAQAAERQPAAASMAPPAASGQPEAAAEPFSAADRQPEAARGQQQSRPATRPAARHGLPHASLQAIADERTQCEGLSLRAFAQRLHDKGIYSATAKDGSRVPANPGTLTKWLQQARRAGVL